MNYEIKGGSFPVVICYLENGEKMITERGSMCWMSPNMQMETKGGGLGKMFSKAFSGESMFQNHYTARGGNGMIAFNSSFPGEIKVVEIVLVKKWSFRRALFWQQRLVWNCLFTSRSALVLAFLAARVLSCNAFPAAVQPLWRSMVI